jgi:gamma-D-glutamyl-L-lysine dipeptidyl-peptidase
MYYQSVVPAAAITRTAAFAGEMTSQLLWGEKCTVLGSEGQKWYHVRCRYDGYEGYVLKSQLLPVDEAVYGQPEDCVAADLTGWYDQDGERFLLPAGAVLTTETAGFYNGRVCDPGKANPSGHALLETARMFSGVSYLWGGKSSFGIDCSGLTQTVFRLHGIKILRDAWQQAAEGEAISFVQEARAGDLAFFDDAEGRIIHVGMLTGDGRIIHASGKVRTDFIDHAGIIHRQSNERTHRLRIIRRYF